MSDIQTTYHGDEFLEPKESVTGAQSIRSSAANKHVSNAELAQARRHNEDTLAEDILEECRVQLMLKFRFLDRALWRMPCIAVRSGLYYPIATDGKYVYYDPERVIARFNESFDECVRDYLHMILHCIFRHPYDRSHKTREAWSLTCDMIAESVAMDLVRDRFPSADDTQRASVIDRLRMLVGSFTPNKVYDLLAELVLVPSGADLNGMGRADLNEWHSLFERDDHSTWPSNSDQSQSEEVSGDASEIPQDMKEDDESPDFQSDGFKAETLGTDESGEEDSRSDDGADAEGDSESAEVPDSEAEESGMLPDSIFDDASSDDEDEQKSEWDEIAKEVEMNLETFSKQWGEEAGSLMANLAISNRRTYDYTDFLRSFMVMTEQIKLNPDEFDYTYYMFGMDMYENMPFIEPLEYKESESIRDFVIAIDTSESVSGPLVRKFIEHTFSILQESRDSNTMVNVHLIQADSKVQSDLKITDLDQVDKLLEGFEVRGFGGTDFRPTFDYVSMLQRRGELENLKGMIYFTDGYGQFPEKVPDYEVAFIFVDDDSREIPPVPPWAMKVVLDERQIERLHE